MLKSINFNSHKSALWTSVYQYVCFVVLVLENMVTNFLYSTLRAPSVSSGAFRVQCCVLSAHASLSLCDRWQRLQDTKLATKPGAPGADKAAFCLAARPLGPPSPELLILLVHCCCVTGKISTVVVCVGFILFIFFVCFLCFFHSALCLDLSHVSFQAKRIKSHLAPSLPLRTGL